VVNKSSHQSKPRLHVIHVTSQFIIFPQDPFTHCINTNFCLCETISANEVIRIKYGPSFHFPPPHLIILDLCYSLCSLLVSLAPSSVTLILNIITLSPSISQITSTIALSAPFHRANEQAVQTHKANKHKHCYLSHQFIAIQNCDWFKVLDSPRARKTMV
jgi:hypothetical protein